MRFHELFNSNINLKREIYKSKLLYEDLPLSANMPARKARIFNTGSENDSSLLSHQRRDTLAYRKMKNWD